MPSFGSSNVRDELISIVANSSLVELFPCVDLYKIIEERPNDLLQEGGDDNEVVIVINVAEGICEPGLYFLEILMATVNYA